MTLTLEDAHVQTIVNALAARPYAEVYEVMGNLQRQVMQQQQPQPQLQAVDAQRGVGAAVTG
jgi:hypothetical protein